MRERQMLKVTKCIVVKYFVEALINMVCELKITSGSRTTVSQDVQTRFSVQLAFAKFLSKIKGNF